MSRIRKATETPPPPTCGASGHAKIIYRTEHAAKVAAEVASSRTYGEEFVVYKCGEHFHIAHKSDRVSSSGIL